MWSGNVCCGPSIRWQGCGAEFCENLQSIYPAGRSCFALLKVRWTGWLIRPHPQSNLPSSLDRHFGEGIHPVLWWQLGTSRVRPLWDPLAIWQSLLWGNHHFFHRFFSNCFFGELSIADGWFTFLVPHMFGIQQKFSVLGCMVLCSTSVDKCGASEKTVPFSSVKWWYYQLSISMCLCYYPNLCRQFGTPLLVSILILWVHNLWAMVRLPLNSLIIVCHLLLLAVWIPSARKLSPALIVYGWSGGDSYPTHTT